MRSPADAAKVASARSAAAEPAGSAVSTATSLRVPSVSVPVLSTQIVSTAASASVAPICWTRVFWRARRTAATASVTLIRSTSPSGIRVTSPAVASWAASRNALSWTVNPSTTISAIGTRAIVVALSTVLTSTCSGEAACRNSRASPAIFSA